MTRPEQMLWSAIRYGQLDGMRFRRQHPLGRFVLDFCCLRHRLVVEVDGAQHKDPDQAAYDTARSEHLRTHRYTVIRFTNDEVLHHLESVLDRIEAAALNTPPPELGEGSAVPPGTAGGWGPSRTTSEPPP